MSRDDALANILEAAIKVIAMTEDRMGIQIDEDIKDACGYDGQLAERMIRFVRERPFNEIGVEAKALLDRLYNVLDAAASDCIDVAENSKAHGVPTVWAKQAQERVDIIHKLVGDERWSPNNPLSILIQNAEGGSQRMRVASIFPSSNNNGEYSFGVQIGNRIIFESDDYDTVEDMVSRINSAVSRP
jgi:hypothetical protein